MKSPFIAGHAMASASFLCVLALGACSDPERSGDGFDSGEGNADVGQGPGTEASCEAVQRVFDTRCLLCHGASALGGLDLRDASVLSEVSSQQSDLPLVDRGGSLEGGYLWHKVRASHREVGGSGDRMPPEAPLTQGELAILEAWLMEGGVCAPAVNPGEDVGVDEDTGPGPGDDECAVVQSVIDLRCVGCHGQIALDGLDLRSVSEAVGRRSKVSPLNLVEAGDSAASYLVSKIADTHLDDGGQGVAMPPGAPLDPSEVSIIRSWIDAGALCGAPPEVPDAPIYDPNDLEPGALFECQGEPSSSAPRLNRIHKREWLRSVGIGQSHPASANPLVPSADLPYSTYTQGVGMDPATLDLYFNVLSYAGGPWTSIFGEGGQHREPRYDTALRCMFNDEAPDAECVENFVRTHLERGALYRPPTAEEVTRMMELADEALDDEARIGGSRAETILQITSGAWLLPSVLFPSEVGAGEEDQHGRRRLSDWEYARVLGRMLSDRAPGSSSVYLYDNNLSGDDRWTDEGQPHLSGIVEAAAEGRIQDPIVVEGLFRQYAAGTDPDREDEWVWYGSHSLDKRQKRGEFWMSDKIDRFFLEFFEVEAFATGFQDTPEATSRFAGDGEGNSHANGFNGLRTSPAWDEPHAIAAFIDTVSRVVSDDSDVLRGLLTTRQWYIPSNTSSMGPTYGPRAFNITEEIGDSRAARWKTLPEAERAGLLTHPVWLAAHGDAFEDGPSMVLRGKWIREKLLCESVPPLQLVTVDAKLVPSAPELNARDRVERSIETEQQCMICHQSMNGLGRAFEIYNHAGYLREDDHGRAPDGGTTIDNAPDPGLNRSYSSALEFVAALADSEHVKRCFVRQTFRHFAGRDETLADACVLSDMVAAYDDSGGSFIRMLEVLATHDVVVYRKEVAP